MALDLRKTMLDSKHIRDDSGIIVQPEIRKSWDAMENTNKKRVDS